MTHPYRGTLIRTLALLGCIGLSSVAQAKVTAVALVIGNNASPVAEPDLTRLRFADDDALRFSEFLGRIAERVEFLSILDDQTQARYPQAAAQAKPPTLAQLDAAVQRLAVRLKEASAAGDQTQAYVTFSGHGSSRSDGEPYLAFLDGDLTGDEIFSRVVAKLPADRVHLIIDACNAGAVVGMRGRFDREGEAETVELSEDALQQIAKNRMLERYPNVGIIVAASAGQETHEWSRIEAGVFSHEILSALLGPADVNGDLLIEYSEVQAFVASANSAVQDPRAKPTIITHAPAADRRSPLVALTSLREMAFLTGRPAALGRFHLQLANGRRYLDAHLDPGGRAAIAIPTDTVVFLRTGTAEASISAKAGSSVDFGELELESRRIAQRGATDEAYRKALFSVPYGVTYYQGYVDSQRLVGVAFDGARAHLLEPTRSRDEIIAWSSWGFGALTLVGTVISGGMAIKTRNDFQATSIQRDATRLSNRYNKLRAASWTLLGLSAMGGAAGWYFWPTVSAGSSGDPEGGETQAKTLRFGLSGSF